MRVDKLKKWTDFRDDVVAISRAIAVAQSQPTPMDIGTVGKVKSGKGGKGSKGAGNRDNMPELRREAEALGADAVALAEAYPSASGNVLAHSD